MTLAVPIVVLLLQQPLPQAPQPAPVVTPDPCGERLTAESAPTQADTQRQRIVWFRLVQRCGAVQISDRARELVGGGSPSEAFPASFVAINDALCGATFIGPRVLVTSGHCMQSSDTMWIEMEGGKRHARCTPHTAGGEGDWALCRLVDGADFDGRSETIAGDANLVAKHKSVLLTGFGHGGAGMASRIFRVGVVEVFDHLLPGSGVQATGEVHVVQGDSGSSAFAYTGARRFVVGVNWWKLTLASGTDSVVSAVTHKRFKDFVDEWLTKDGSGQQICGINWSSADKCR